MQKIVATILLTCTLLVQNNACFAAGLVQTEKKETVNLKAALKLEPPYYIMKDGLLSGVEFDIIKEIFSKDSGLNVVYDQNGTTWKEAVDSVKEGTKDFVAGATETEERKVWAIFSDSYRNETHVVLMSDKKAASFDNAQKFLQYAKDNRIEVQILDGAVYNSDEINDAIKNPQSGITFVKHDSDVKITSAVLGDENKVGIVEGVTAAAILKGKTGFKLIDVKAAKPQHFMFSKKIANVADLVARVNVRIKESAARVSAILSK